MSEAPRSPALATLRSAADHEADTVRDIWERSHDRDDSAGRPKGGWSVEPWATALRVLDVGGQVVGVAAVRAEPPPAEAVAARVALDPAHRTAEFANLLVQACVDLACEAHGERVRFFSAASAAWMMAAVRAHGFRQVRAIYHMLLAPGVALAVPRSLEGLEVRAMRDGEEARVLRALNRAWAGTWDFVPIRPAMLDEDLAGQREGMLLAIDAAAGDERIVATCHAVFDPTDRNPDGGPRAWISNLTVDPEYRGRGLARSMLLVALRHLRGRGAGSITLGVDAGDPAPLGLYQSVGFVEISTVEAWDKPLAPYATRPCA